MSAETASSESAPELGRQGLRLRVRHRTAFEYQGPVHDSFNDARLCPITEALQSCVAFSLAVEPVVNVHTYHDFYLNRVDHFEIHHPHEHLVVDADSLVQTRPDARGNPGKISPDLLNDPTLDENYFDFLSDSHFVTLDAAIWREAIDVLPEGVTDLWGDSVKIGRHIFRRFTYTPQSTHAGTRLTDVLRERRGVCQDFAHVMLGMCRTQGIPARYVSGYFFNENRKADEVEASHAWVEVFLPGFGWKGFDPTHDREADTRYVKLAVGRDYGDIRPINGSYRGRGTKKLTVEVHITREED